MASVPSASCFSLPLPPWHQPLGTRVARYETRKRRKAFADGSQSDSDDGETTDAASASEKPLASPLILSPDEAHQYRVAGLSFDQELPKGHFPHGPSSSHSERQRPATQHNLIEELSNLSPPIYLPQSADRQRSLRLRHLSAITAILHRCLLDEDYIRAGRAWGLILRENYAGFPVDVRSEGRWGIGAEILLRRDLQMSKLPQEQDLADEKNRPGVDSFKPLFTREGFENAKQYYERLIIQYPYRRATPNAVSSLHFYPAMFGLWIYVAHEESNATAARLMHRVEDESSGEYSDDEDIPSYSEHLTVSGRNRRLLLADVKAKELDQAKQIAGRMDEVLVSPPFADSPELLELRGMVSLWIGDLLVSSLLPSRPMTERDFDGMEDSSDSIHARREQRLANEKRLEESRKAKEFFDKARQRGRHLASSLENLHIEDAVFTL